MSAAAGQHPGRARYSREVATLRAAAREFAHRRSIWIILAVIALTAAIRVAIGDWSWRDGAAVATMLVVYPFGEWAIHVYVLHMKPFTFRGKRVDPPAAKGHRAHHRKPNDLWVLLLEGPELVQLLLVAVPLTIAVVAAPVWLLAGPIPVGVLVTAVLTDYVLIGAYEWTHFLIHTAYRPRSRYTGRSGETTASTTSRTSTSGTGSRTTSATGYWGPIPTRGPWSAPRPPALSRPRR